LIKLDSSNEERFRGIEEIMEIDQLRPPTPSLSMLNIIERKELAPDHEVFLKSFSSIPPTAM